MLKNNTKFPIFIYLNRFLRLVHLMRLHFERVNNRKTSTQTKIPSLKQTNKSSKTRLKPKAEQNNTYRYSLHKLTSALAVQKLLELHGHFAYNVPPNRFGVF